MINVYYVMLGDSRLWARYFPHSRGKHTFEPGGRLSEGGMLHERIRTFQDVYQVVIL